VHERKISGDENPNVVAGLSPRQFRMYRHRRRGFVGDPGCAGPAK
jgi:hypothetical protein